MKYSLITAASLSALLCACQTPAAAGKLSADDAVKSVSAYGFVDLEGAKTSAVIVEYAEPLAADSVDAADFEITTYAKRLVAQQGFEKAVELDRDGVAGNEGEKVKVYVNDKPEPSQSGGTASGRYVIIEVNTAYMLNGQNLVYTTSMMADAKQVGKIQTASGKTVMPSEKAFANYTITQQYNAYRKQNQDVIDTDKTKIILPQFTEAQGWTLHTLENQPFQAKHAYSEYTGKYEDFAMPYSIYVPPREVLERNKGKLAFVIHMEHAGGNSTDPMSAITSSRAAAKLSGDHIQSRHPAIVVVPQIEEKRRSTDDMAASSEANAAIWQLIDSLLAQYKGYIDENRIYGTGQSMGGMTLLNMAAQRDNFFGGLALVGAQWGNNYDKPFQHNGSPARSPANDKTSFNGFGLDKANYQNWYYMVSDDNILVHTAKDDVMATGQWQDLADYYAAAGVKIAQDEWDPYLPVAEQNARDQALYSHANTAAGSGITWGKFTRGTHMSTWKYGYQIDAPFEWLFAQSRQTALKRSKIEALKQPWRGRDNQGRIRAGSGTAGLNSAQFTPNGASKVYTEGWTPVSAVKTLIAQLPDTLTPQDKRAVAAARTAYQNLTAAQRRAVGSVARLQAAEQTVATLPDAPESAGRGKGSH